MLTIFCGSTIQLFEKEATIIHIGDSADGFYVILKGVASVSI